MYEGCPDKPEVVQIPASGTMGDCESLPMGARNQTRVLSNKSSQCSWSLNYFLTS